MAQTPCNRVSDGIRLPHTFSADAAVGDVIEVGTVPAIVAAAVDFSEQPIGTLDFGGCWDVPQVAGILTAGDAVYWDNNGSPYGGTASSGCATGTASGNNLMGLVAPTQPNGTTATTATDSYVRVIMTAAKRTATVAGSMTADDITGSDASMGIGGKAGAASAGGAVAGTGGAGDGAGNAGGAWTKTGGAGVAHTTGTGGAGGSVADVGGAAGGCSSGTGGAGGAADRTGGAGGAASGAGTGGAGGSVMRTGGVGGAAVGDTGGAGGSAATTAGAGGADSSAGTGGAGGSALQTSGVGGAASGAGTGGAGGAAGAVGGAGGTTATGTGGAGTDVVVTGGAGGAASGAGTGGAGADVILTAGAGGATDGGTAGVPGYVKVNSFAGLVKAQTIDMADAAVTLTRTTLTGNWLLVDPNSGGAAEILKLPPEADMTNVMLIIKNTGGENITLQNDAAGAIGTIEDAECAFVHCDGTDWTIIQAVETT